ncbi:LPS assembly lipoprotein LptE [Chelatococcus sp. SYSU_G07232]|uniref:LPS assembly lipoprotein LptE n=1 Tax=Chelatococcus albus TaxID=3047466 RepID=A0ABT7AH46_9HYPH|nr:LPS assembly lipoprotein LptE [Chelatococcus sp. SYSU_G07232]MDJ1158706.1 LPS assembly lipoprotein LptE [Chelatococcus sp. SYSU_G07232]
MSSPDHVSLRRRALSLAVVGTLALGLAGCFRPLYGTTAAGTSVQDTLAAIDVPQIRSPNEGRLGHYLRNELAFDLGGGAPVQAKRYRLEITTTERVQTAIVDTQTGRADSATLIAEATYTLKPLGDGPAVTTGKAIASASYDRSSQRFTTLRAARDAEIRVASLLAEQIKTRIAAMLATRS